MQRQAIDFTIEEAGCLLYAADLHLGGQPFGSLDNRDWQTLTEKGAFMATSLYQDDGYNVRVVSGELTAEEEREWTARAAWKLNLESGVMVVSGVCDPDLENYLKDFPVARTGGSYHLGCRLAVEPGKYAVSIYSYPPNDLSGGWMAIENPRDFKACFDAESPIEREKPLAYFNRTHAGETPPEWIRNGWEEADFLDFLIHLAPLEKDLETPAFDEDGCLSWRYRKPAICPVGIRL